MATQSPGTGGRARRTVESDTAERDVAARESVDSKAEEPRNEMAVRDTAPSRDTEPSGASAGAPATVPATWGIPAESVPPAAEGTTRQEDSRRGTGLVDQARDAALRGLDTQRARAAAGLTSLVEAVRESGRNVQGQHAAVASYVDAAASQMQRLAERLRDRDLRRLRADLETFAGRRPAMFVGGAFALGLLAARFLKSSADVEEPWRTSGSAPTGPSTGHAAASRSSSMSGSRRY